MEQQIDPKTKIEIGVGTDPAYIPGLTAPAPAAKGGEEGKKRAEETAPEDETASEAEAETGTDAEGDEPLAAVGGTPAEESDAEPAGDDAADGPVFEVRDRRGSITADRSGIRFTLDDQEADFHWDEIGAVEVKPARFGRRFTVTVHVAANRWFNADVEAPARSRLSEWTAELDAVLDAYFEES
ncbi:hypothetical protein ABZ070_01660 [Streptomyces sp. NPDC006283]|uniref:hypothetical protein n=1 Tax=Streptomyces sp. NPDC006283 TaxID=3156741 RepID=UPI0033AD615A